MLYGQTLVEIIPQLSLLGQSYPITPLSRGSRIELYQNATPWKKRLKDCDADIVGALQTSGARFDNLDLDRCHWSVYVDEFERISLVVQEIDPHTQQLLQEVRFPCGPVHY